MSSQTSADSDRERKITNLNMMFNCIIENLPAIRSDPGTMDNLKQIIINLYLNGWTLAPYFYKHIFNEELNI